MVSEGAMASRGCEGLATTNERGEVVPCDVVGGGDEELALPTGAPFTIEPAFEFKGGEIRK